MSHCVVRELQEQTEAVESLARELSQICDNAADFQPKEWIAAFKIQATRDDQRLAEWIGECCVQFLDADLKEGLVKRLRGLRKE